MTDASSGGTSSDGRGVLCPTCAAAGQVACIHAGVVTVVTEWLPLPEFDATAEQTSYPVDVEPPLEAGP